MTPTKRKKQSSANQLLRGLVTISVSAAALCLLLFFLVPHAGGPGAEPMTSPSLPEEIHSAPQVLTPNPYGPEDFEYQGDYLTCVAGNSVLGVDVSAHQQEIDWEQVKNAGMEFAIIRVGYRGYTSGGIYSDEYARRNLEGAAKAGLKIGAYFYSQAISPTEAALEAAYCISLLKDYRLDMPVVFDWETVDGDARTDHMDPETLTACVKTFCDAVADAGYRPMVYFNPALAESLLDLEALKEYPFWLAMYSDQMTFPHAVEMWQYTASGTVPGISGSTDINLWFPE